MKQHNLKEAPDNKGSYNDKANGITQVHVSGNANSTKQDSEKQFSGKKPADSIAQDIFGALNY